MILLDAVVQILALVDTGRFQPVTGSIQQPAFAVTNRDGLPVCLAAVDDNAPGSVVTLKQPADKSSRGRQIPMLAEEELDRVANTVDGSIQIHPLSADPNISLAAPRCPPDRQCAVVS